MINIMIVDILVRRILKQGVNPKTNEIFRLEDIKTEEYKIAVENEILERQQVI